MALTYWGACGAPWRARRAVFLGFASDPDVIVKMIGVGLASAIIVDVLVVRLMLAPAVMVLLGHRGG